MNTRRFRQKGRFRGSTFKWSEICAISARLNKLCNTGMLISVLAGALIVSMSIFAPAYAQEEGRVIATTDQQYYNLIKNASFESASNGSLPDEFSQITASGATGSLLRANTAKFGTYAAELKQTNTDGTFALRYDVPMTGFGDVDPVSPDLTVKDQWQRVTLASANGYSASVWIYIPSSSDPDSIVFDCDGSDYLYVQIDAASSDDSCFVDGFMVVEGEMPAGFVESTIKDTGVQKLYGSLTINETDASGSGGDLVLDGDLTVGGTITGIDVEDLPAHASTHEGGGDDPLYWNALYKASGDTTSIDTAFIGDGEGEIDSADDFNFASLTKITNLDADALDGENITSFLRTNASSAVATGNTLNIDSGATLSIDGNWDIAGTQITPDAAEINILDGGLAASELDSALLTETEGDTNYVNVSGDTMTGALSMDALGTADAGNTTYDSNNMVFEGSYWDEAQAQDASMTIFTDVTGNNEYELDILNKNASSIFTIDESGNVNVLGTLTAASLEGPMVSNGTTSDAFEIDTDDSSATPTLTFGANASAAPRIETQVGDLTIAPAGGDTFITGNMTVSGTFTADNFSGDYDGTINASQVQAGTFAAGNFIFPDNLTVNDDLTVDTDTLYVDSADDMVGIGTTNPAMALHLQDDSNYQLRMQETGAAEYMDLGWDKDGNVGELMITAGGQTPRFQTRMAGSGTARQFSFITDDGTTEVERLTILRNGSVGIGLTNPTYGFDVAGTGHFAGNVDMDAGLDVTGTVAATSFSGDGSSITSIEAANVDVVDSGSNYTGTTVETILAEISDSHIEATDNPHSVTYTQVGAIQDAANTVKENHIDFGTGANQVAISDFPEGDNTYVNIGGDTMTGSLVFSNIVTDITTATDEHLVLSPAGTGNVGIGTTAPATALDVAGTITADGLTIDGTVSGSGFSGWDTNASDDLTTATTFGGEVSGTYDAIVVDNDALDDQYIELGDTFAGEVSGTYGAIVLDNDALDDQYIELGDAFGGDVSGTYNNLQLGTGVVGATEIATDAVGADELSSSAIQAGDIEAADLPADGYASTYVNADGDTMTGDLSIASATPSDLIIDNTTVGTPDGGNLASDSGSVYLRGNYFDDTSDTDTEIDMSVLMDVTDASTYKLSIFDDGQTTELFSIDESGNVNVTGTLTAASLEGPMVSNGTTSDAFTIDSDNSATTPTLTFGGAGGSNAVIETQVGDITLDPAGGDVLIDGTLTATNISGTYNGTVSASQVTSGTFAAGDFTFQDNLTVGDNLVVDTDTLFVDSADDSIGIGTTNPVYNLDVAGTGHFTGNVDMADGLDVTGTVAATSFSGDGSSITSIEAANVDVADSGTNYTGTTVEAILAEISDDHIEATDNPHSVTYAQVGAIQDAADTVKESHLDFGTGANQIAISDFPEGTNTYVNISGDTMTGALTFSGIASDITTATDEDLAIMPAGTGYVGIGTTAPATMLDVAGTITGDGLTIDGTVGGTGFSGWDTNASDDLTTATSFGGEVSGTYDAIVLSNDALDDQYIELGDTFAGEVSGTYDAIVLNNDALDDQYIELGDAFGGEVSGTYGAIVIDNDALDDQYIELGDSFDGDVSGTYDNVQIAAGAVGATEIATDAVGADELSSSAIQAGDIEAADLPADGYASTYVNADGDTMTGDLSIASTTPADLIIDNTTVGTPDGGNLASDSGSTYFRGNYFDDSTDTDTEVDMSVKLDVATASEYKLSIFDDGQNAEVFSIDESGNVVVAGTLSAGTLSGPMVTSGTNNATFTADADNIGGSEPADGAGFIIEGGSGDVSLVWDATNDELDISGDVEIGGALTVVGDLVANNFSGSFDGTINASQVQAGTFAAGDFTFQDNLSVSDNLGVTADLTVDTNTLYVDSADDSVGIGTTNPAYNLDVDGTGHFSGNVNIDNGLDVVGAAITSSAGLTVSAGAVSLPNGEIGTDEIADDAITAAKLNVVGIDGTTGKVTAINSTNFTSLDGSNLTSLEAANVDVVDSGSNYTGTTVETILAEISDSHIEATDNPHSVTYTQVGAIQDAADTVKESHLDFGTGANQIAISDFPEGTNTYVNINGDTMTGTLNLPANGLVLGTDQLVAANTNVGIGMTDPTYKLDVAGTARFTGNIDATSGLDVSGAALTSSAGLTVSSGSVVLPDNSVSTDDIDWSDAHIDLTAEYPNSTYVAPVSSSGTLSVGNEGSGVEWRNFYKWRAHPATPQSYEIYIRVTLPSDFAGWADSNAILIDFATETTAAADADLDIEIYLDSSSTADATSSNNVSSVAGTWEQISIDDSVLGDWNAAGETGVIMLKVTSKNNKYVKMGDIQLNYKR